MDSDSNRLCLEKSTTSGDIKVDKDKLAILKDLEDLKRLLTRGEIIEKELGQQLVFKQEEIECTEKMSNILDSALYLVKNSSAFKLGNTPETREIIADFAGVMIDAGWRENDTVIDVKKNRRHTAIISTKIYLEDLKHINEMFDDDREAFAHIPNAHQKIRGMDSDKVLPEKNLVDLQNPESSKCFDDHTTYTAACILGLWLIPGFEERKGRPTLKSEIVKEMEVQIKKEDDDMRRKFSSGTAEYLINLKERGVEEMDSEEVDTQEMKIDK